MSHSNILFNPRYLTGQRAGFTLVEISVVALLLALLAAISFRLTSSSNTSAMPNLTNRLFLQMEGRKLADNILEEIRKSSDVVRPAIGETTPFLLMRNAENLIVYYYLTHDKENSEKFKRKLYELLAFTHDYNGKNDKLNKMGNCIESVSFTGVSPGCVQLNIKVRNDKSEFQFISQASLMSLGDEYD